MASFLVQRDPKYYVGVATPYLGIQVYMITYFLLNSCGLWNSEPTDEWKSVRQLHQLQKRFLLPLYLLTELEENGTRDCLETGLWSNPDPTCERNNNVYITSVLIHRAYTGKRYV